MKFGQLFIQKSCRKWNSKTSSRLLFALQNSFICVKIKFLRKWSWPNFFLPQLVYDFSEKYYSCCILSTDQISLSDCFYFFKYLAICAFHSFFPNLWQYKSSKQPFISYWVVFLHDLKSQGHLKKYLKNEKSFQGEIINVFYHS